MRNRKKIGKDLKADLAVYKSSDKISVSEIKALRAEIERHNKLYYRDSNPEISDAEYDQLVLRLRKIEQPFLFDLSESISEKVGYKADDKFKKVHHDRTLPMLSLANIIYDEKVKDHDNREDELSEFYEKIRKASSDEKPELTVEFKVDGLALSLKYENGSLIQVATRGDGFVGEDLTENGFVIDDIPKQIDTNLKSVEIRGECYLSKENFAKINKAREENDLPLFANARNAAAGSIKNLDPEITKSRNLNFFGYGYLPFDEDGRLSVKERGKKYSDSIKKLASLGFKTLDILIFKELEDIKKTLVTIEKEKNKLKFDIDGVVITANDFILHTELGYTAKAPRFAIAYKFKPSEKKSKIIDVSFNVSRLGNITPIAIIEPVRISGSMISRVTLHNEDFILEKDIRINDYAFFKKSGDVIPQLVSIVKSERTTDGKKIIFPEKCPSCLTILERKKSSRDLGYIYTCTNKECIDKLIAKAIHFVSRDALDIKSLGEKTIRKLVENKLIKSPADIYSIKKEDLIKLDKIKEKSATRIMASINKSKQEPLWRFVHGLGIPEVGIKFSKLIAKRFQSLDKIKTLKVDDLVDISSVGDTKAQYIKEFLEDQKNLLFLEKLNKAVPELREKQTETYPEQLNLKGKIFVITGRLASFTREIATSKIEALGGIAKNNVSANIDYLIAGIDPQTKLKKANEINDKLNIANEKIRSSNSKIELLNQKIEIKNKAVEKKIKKKLKTTLKKTIKIISEEQFLKMLESYQELKTESETINEYNEKIKSYNDNLA